MASEKIVVELLEKIAKSALYISKGVEIEGIAKERGIKVRKIENADMERVSKILSKGEPLSKIIIEHRGA